VPTHKRMIHYAMLLCEGRWIVRRDVRYHGPYPSYDAARQSAITAAHTSGKNDRGAQVLTEGEDGSLMVEWTFEVDDHPAQGVSMGLDGSRPPSVNSDSLSTVSLSKGAAMVLAWTRTLAPF
jgi:hypothetical protein